MNIPKIYAETIEGEFFDDGESKIKMDSFFLDGEALEINGYHTCMGNIQALSMAMKENIFEAVLVFWDGSKKGCKVWSYYDKYSKTICGYILLPNDETVAPFISKALNKMEITNTFYNVDEKGNIHFKHEKNKNM
jgi:hypothetical protein